MGFNWAERFDDIFGIADQSRAVADEHVAAICTCIKVATRHGHDLARLVDCGACGDEAAGFCGGVNDDAARKARDDGIACSAEFRGQLFGHVGAE